MRAAQAEKARPRLEHGHHSHLGSLYYPNLLVSAVGWRVRERESEGEGGRVREREGGRVREREGE